MELDYAMLADAAQVAEGKTYILGGGVSILFRSQLPAALGVTLVLQLTYERTEANSDHQLRIVVMDADGHPILPEITGEMHLGPAPEGLPRGVPLIAALTVGFPPLPVIQRNGEYAVDILLDGRHLKRLPFAVAQPPAPPTSTP
jgi:hypothetical protein